MKGLQLLYWLVVRGGERENTSSSLVEVSTGMFKEMRNIMEKSAFIRYCY